MFDQNEPQSVEYYEKEGPVHRSVKSPHKLLQNNGKSTNIYDYLKYVMFHFPMAPTYYAC